MATKKKKSVKKKAVKKAAKAGKKVVKKASTKAKKTAAKSKKKVGASKKKPARKKPAPQKKKAVSKKKAGAGKKTAATKKKTAAAKKKAAATKKKAVRATKKAVKAGKVGAKTRKPAAKTGKKKAVKSAKKPVSSRKKPVAKKGAVKSATGKTLPPPGKYAPTRPPVPAPSKRRRNIKKLTAKELKEYRQRLLNLRDQVVDGISFLSGDNLNRSQRDASGDLSGYSLHMADQGTDNYDREFALNLVSSEQDILYEIDEAIRRIDSGKYGICELTGEPIERARLKVIPYARYSVAAQSEMERGKTRYRPFGPTLSHGG